MKIKLKGLLQKPFVKNVLAPIVRGGVKLIPVIGTPAVEIIENLTKPKSMVASLATIKVGDTMAATVDVLKPNKHSWISIVVQCVLGIAILYAFYSKAITIQDVIALIKGLFGLP